jgi:hypothetical protein
MSEIFIFKEMGGLVDKVDGSAWLDELVLQV